MTRLRGRLLASFVLVAALSAGSALGDRSEWTTLIEGTRGMNNFNVVGTANWTATEGAIHAEQGSSGSGFLVSKASYKDFVIRVEFWASAEANSGVFLRCQDPKTITPDNSYEVNIFDQRPDPTYGTGGIVNVAKVADPMPKAGGRWNTFEITARGSSFVVVLNGKKTVEVDDSKHASGPFALQWAGGTIKFRKVEIRQL